MDFEAVLDLIQAEIIANGNNEITADVLRPVLEAMLMQPNELVGALEDLNTSDITSIVNAINSILSLNIPAKTALRAIDITGIDTNQSELLWVRDAVNQTAANNGAFTCNPGEMMVFFCDVLIGSDESGISTQRRYYRLTNGATVVNNLSGSLNPPLMPDGVETVIIDISGDLVIDLGNIGSSAVHTAFNSSGGQPYDMNNDMFVIGQQEGMDKVWKWIGGVGLFGNSATPSSSTDFVDLNEIPTIFPNYLPPKLKDTDEFTIIDSDLFRQLYCTENDTEISIPDVYAASVNTSYWFRVYFAGTGAHNIYDEATDETYPFKQGDFVLCEKKYGNNGWIVKAVGGGSTEWGDITGTLSAQTDLQSALDVKEDKRKLTFVEASTSTDAGTAEKVATTVGGSYTPVKGDIIYLTLSTANTNAAPTLNIDGSGAYPIELGGNATTAIPVTSALKYPLWFDGSAYQLFGSQRIVDINYPYSASTLNQLSTFTSSATLTVDNYRVDGYAAGKTLYTLPADAVYGSEIEIYGLAVNGFRITAPAGDNILMGGFDSGDGGWIETFDQRVTIKLRCVVSNTVWEVVSVENGTVINNNGDTFTTDPNKMVVESVNQTILTQYTESTVSGDDGSNLIQPDLGLPLLEVDDLQEDSSYSGELVLNIENNSIATAKVIELFGAEIYNNTNPSADITAKITFAIDFFNQVGDDIDYILSWEYLSSGEVLFGEHTDTIDNTSDVDFELIVTGHSTDDFNLKKARLWRN